MLLTDLTIFYQLNFFGLMVIFYGIKTNGLEIELYLSLKLKVLYVGSHLLGGV